MLYLIVFLSSILFSQPSTNYKVLDSLANIQTNQIAKTLKEKNKNEFYLNIISPYNPIIFKSNLLENFNSFNLNNIENSDTLSLYLIDYGVNYLSIDDDLLMRHIKIKSMYENTNFFIEHKDTISRSELVIIENTNFEELKATVPNAKASYFDLFLEPIVAVTSGIITLVLLFTVRS